MAGRAFARGLDSVAAADRQPGCIVGAALRFFSVVLSNGLAGFLGAAAFLDRFALGDVERPT